MPAACLRLAGAEPQRCHLNNQMLHNPQRGRDARVARPNHARPMVALLSPP